jgi:2-polyprenyl-3-methyl-5-hydroxy-6-metoxy-1,4-benzoquinol methylase
MAHSWSPKGLHEFVCDNVIRKYARPGLRAIDLGTGGGSMAEKMRDLGCDVIASDLSAEWYKADLPHITVDMNERDFASVLGEHAYGLVTAIEVIEHLESPISFLRNVERLLSPGGVGVVSTPNVDSLPARLRFLQTGKLRMMDDRGEPTHISPLFFDLVQRKYLPIAGLRLREHLVFPSDGFHASRKSVAWVMVMCARAFQAKSIIGDHQILVLEKSVA